MAYFEVASQGSGKEGLRSGGKKSGVWSHTCSWKVGVEVRGYIDSDGSTCFDIYQTNGSADIDGEYKHTKHIATITEGE